MSEIKLKPCPFCGGEARLIQIQEPSHKFWADGLYYIEVKHAINPPSYICPLYSHDFGHYGGGYDNKAERYSDVTIKAHKACEEWNRRADNEQGDGEWVKSEIPGEEYVCSACGGACWYYDVQGVVAKSRYCPNCGAKMKGGAE